MSTQNLRVKLLLQIKDALKDANVANIISRTDALKLYRVFPAEIIPGGQTKSFLQLLKNLFEILFHT